MEGEFYSRQREEDQIIIIVTRIINFSLLGFFLLQVFAFFAEREGEQQNLVSYCKKFSLVLSGMLAHEGLDVF